MTIKEMRAAIELMRGRNIDKHGLKDTLDIDKELQGATVREQFRAWRELSV